jgi:hypothetical protein
VRESRRFLIWYAAGLAGALLFLFGLILARGVSLGEAFERLPRFARWMSRNPLTYLLAFLPYLCDVAVRALREAYRRGGVRALAFAATWRVAVPALVVVALGFGYRAYRNEGVVSWNFDRAALNETGRARGLYERDGKMRGVNLVSGRPMEDAALDPLVRDNVEWVSVSPFGWQEGLDGDRVEVSGEGGYWSESDSGVVALAGMARARGLHVMLKPHLWITGDHGGSARLADLDPGTPERWRAWFVSYRGYLLHYAALAERAGVDLLCIGAEVKRAAVGHEAEWRAMIADVRRVYHGRLTYAANWYEEAEAIRFWDALDYIGVQAYYPLSTDATDDRAKIERGWAAHLAALERLHRRWGKPILFTEIGWKSTADATVRPWEWTEARSQMLARVSTRTQAAAYEAFFRTAWREPWLAGAFLWKWYGRHERAGGADDPDFTPQNKPAEAIIAREFGEVATVVTAGGAGGGRGGSGASTRATESGPAPAPSKAGP